MNSLKESWEKLWKDQGMRRWIILLVVGILIVILIPAGGDDSRNFWFGSDIEGEGSENHDAAYGDRVDTDIYSGEDWSVTAYEKELETRLTHILGRIQGAGQVQVMVTVRQSSELILQQDVSREEEIVRETDSQGGTRDNSQVRQDSQTVLLGGSGISEPYVVGEIMPRVEGVVVTCEGGDRASVQAEISAAVQALFDLAPHKIKVCKMASP